MAFKIVSMFLLSIKYMPFFHIPSGHSISYAFYTHYRIGSSKVFGLPLLLPKYIKNSFVEEVMPEINTQTGKVTGFLKKKSFIQFSDKNLHQG